MNWMVFASVMILCFFVNKAKSQDSLQNSFKDENCQPSSNYRYDLVLIKGVEHKYFFHSYYREYRDTAKKNQYNGTIILENFLKVSFNDKKAIARNAAEKYCLRRVHLVSSWLIVDYIQSSLFINKEFAEKRKKIIEMNRLEFTEKELE